MSSSSWPPQLKYVGSIPPGTRLTSRAWVQECLAQATTANKPAVNAELKQVNGTLRKSLTADLIPSTSRWNSQHDRLEQSRAAIVRWTCWRANLRLKKQATRVAPHIPIVQPIVAQPYMSPAYPAPVYTPPVYAAPSYTPPPPSSSAADFVSFHSSPQQPQHTNKKKEKQKEKQKKRKKWVPGWVWLIAVTTTFRRLILLRLLKKQLPKQGELRGSRTRHHLSMVVMGRLRLD